MRFVQRFKMMRAFYSLVRDPRKTESVFEMSNAGIAQRGPLVAKSVQAAVSQVGFQQLYESGYNPRIAPLAELAKYPEGTFGRAFAQHMLSNGLEVDFFPRRLGDGVESYLINRGRASHDFWHVLTGFDTSVSGEIGLQAFTLAQIRSAFSALLIAGGLLHAITRNPEIFDQTIDRLFAGYQIGLKSKSLLGVPLETLFAENLDDLRARLNIEPITVHEEYSVRRPAART